MNSEMLTVLEVENQFKSGECFILDVPEPDEFNNEHIPGAVNLPLSSLNPYALESLNSQRTCVIQCQTGSRAEEAHRKLKSASANLSLSILEGGLAAWKKAGLEVILPAQSRLPVMRLVQIIAGSLVFVSTILGIIVHPGFLGIPIFVGAGLTVAGVTGWCGMAILVNKLRANYYE